ncbi:c-type cytochrome [Borborobacter arsenicus]
MVKRWASVAMLCVCVLHVGTPFAQEQSYGEAEYLNSCAACHGLYGRGDGPLAEVLTKRPADLTVLEMQNGGEFPYYLVFATIDGRSMTPSHGAREMPVWGQQFLEDDSKAYGPIGGEAVTQERIHALTNYIATLQR